MGKPTIFLDRDGIINEVYVVAGKPYPPACVEAVQLTEGIKELIDYLHENYLIIVVTNQPDVARGIQTWTELEKINLYLQEKLPKIDCFMVCPHDLNDNCNCRKPKIGLFLQASEKYNIDFSHSYMIGDRFSDIEAGKNAGCKTVFVDYNYNEKKPNADYVVKSIKEIKDIIENDKNIC